MGLGQVWTDQLMRCSHVVKILGQSSTLGSCLGRLETHTPGTKRFLMANKARGGTL